LRGSGNDSISGNGSGDGAANERFFPAAAAAALAFWWQ
jgi:hypothetical protein